MSAVAFTGGSAGRAEPEAPSRGSRIEASAEHEFEAQPGLPEPLPADERIVWQGAPDFAALARQGFHVRALAIYFAIILALRAATVVGQGGTALDAAVAVLWLLPAALLVVGLVATLAWLTARTTAYTITDKRVVMRIGIVLSVTYNLPFGRIAAAAVSGRPGGAGDIALTLEGTDRIAWLQLWPHTRPWHLAKPQPSLRCIADVHAIGRLLGEAWQAVRQADAAAPVVAMPSADEPRTEATSPQRRPIVAAVSGGTFMHAARRLDAAAGEAR